MDDPELAALVTRMIVEERWSSEQIAGRIAIERPGLAVSCATVYRAIAGRAIDPPGLTGTARGIRSALRHRGKRRRRGRPRGEARQDTGHTPHIREAGGGRGALAAGRLGGRHRRREGRGAVPRHARRPRERAPRGRQARVPHQGGRRRRRDRGPVAPAGGGDGGAGQGKGVLRFREGVEAETGAVFCSALPHHSWQRGANENTNGLPREYFPKGTDFAGVPYEEVERVYDTINRRPRKRLGFRTPYEVHHSKMSHLL